MGRQLGYLVPEFPGQTHIFFWREVAALENMGVRVHLLSTKPPVRGIVSHDWSEEAAARTVYLSQLSRNLGGTLLELIRSGPSGWLRCGRAVLAADDTLGARRLRLLALVLAGANLAAVARRHALTHVHIHSCANSANVGMFAWLLARVPYSISLHGPLSDYGGNQAQKWRHARFAIVITRKLYDEVRVALSGSLPQLLAIAPMGVDLSRFRRQGRYVPWAGEGVLRIVSCGRLNPCKGHATLVKAIAILRARGLDVRLEIVGEDDLGGAGYRSQLQAVIDGLSLQSQVRLLGAVSEELVRQALERAHIFSLASIHEPLGVAIMEAMAMELPVVVTGAGGVAELVDDGTDGVLVPPEDANRLAEGIASVAGNAALADSLGLAARKKIERRFQSTRSAELLVQSIGGD